MRNINQEDVHIVNRHSNLAEKNVTNILHQNVYSDQAAWIGFIRLFLISLGVGFTTAGVLFFFAYNWSDLHKFVKIGLLEFLVAALILIVLLSKINSQVKNILLLAASMLVGVSFAVFGQVYQTGANAYDFFLGWTICVSLWVFVSRFAPLWLGYILLINTTIGLYALQVAQHWSEVLLYLILFVVNAAFLFFALYKNEKIKTLESPNWFSNTIALGTVLCSTFGITTGIFKSFEFSFLVLLVLASLLYFIGFKYGIKNKNSFYIAIISFSLIVIFSSLLMNFSDDASMYLFVSLFVIGGVTYVVKMINDLHKQWTK